MQKKKKKMLQSKLATSKSPLTLGNVLVEMILESLGNVRLLVESDPNGRELFTV